MPVVTSILTDVFHVIKIICIYICFFSFNYRDVRFVKEKLVISVVAISSISIGMFYCFNPIVDLFVSNLCLRR